MLLDVGCLSVLISQSLFNEVFSAAVVRLALALLEVGIVVGIGLVDRAVVATTLRALIGY